ncbi:amino acid/amide ABC transporter ATP-binding protein 1, HAAT family [Clostridium aceticum]|uniref:Amino acid/amide ABC transporter ATP-binding protein 1, HAAT family n=1 Tax=Clostridium aceticum TaxID=84022 RepID=A0A0D8I713_9CLOT|nr:ABC transporter ATP-binding protein [Clostridium aceticum]AKL93811.1 amino acid/amide ABC transporter ATP-binding protein 1, HAAT family [Clostridium aceticum]KJF25839.1 leucine/isoleucine/valine transporter ATP-binding subunit [Clostridium aceticum]
MTILKTDHITMRFGGLTAVKEFNLEIHQGEIVALIGPNGAGKTTAFNMITGVYRPTEGKIIFNNGQITGLKPHEITKRGMARTFQNIRLFKELSVLDNVFIANHLHLKSNLLQSIGGKMYPDFLDKIWQPKYKKEEKEILEKSHMLLEKVGLVDLRHEKASSLPYGVQRKLEIARALATDPKLLLLDEPAAGMNPKETNDLTDFIRQIRDEFDLTIFLIEHHMQVVMDISNRIYVLDYGVTIAEGSPYEIQNNERVIQAYLGVSEDA